MASLLSTASAGRPVEHQTIADARKRTRDERKESRKDDSKDEVSRDIDMEEKLANAADSDPLAAYDVDVRIEGEAINEYLARIAGTSM